MHRFQRPWREETVGCAQRLRGRRATRYVSWRWGDIVAAEHASGGANGLPLVCLRNTIRGGRAGRHTRALYPECLGGCTARWAAPTDSLETMRIFWGWTISRATTLASRWAAELAGAVARGDRLHF
jgi:hypothetical protein